MECGVCWTVYDSAEGDPARQIPPGTSFDELPDDWCCPHCDAARYRFVRPIDGH
ncbi:Hydrogenase maturation factor HoxR [Rhodovulum sp. PH10]|nr:Hydrogenase maturation factor HoxR [Rhodovulum sp. PH10]